jgi:hypothetical protein
LHFGRDQHGPDDPTQNLTRNKLPTGGSSVSTRIEDLDNARLGVLYFVGNLRCDLSPEESVSDLKKAATGFLKGKVSDSRLNRVGAVMGGVDSIRNAVKQEVDEIAEAVQSWLTTKFKVSASDAELAIQHLRHNLPEVISGISSDIKGGTGGSSGPPTGEIKGIAKGLYTGVTKTIEFYELKQKSADVVLESGHPDQVASAITRAVGRSALAGLAEAALAGAKIALSALTAGVGEIINMVAGIIERILRFAVRFCDALALRKAFAAAKSHFANAGLGSAIHSNAAAFSDWFKKVIDRSPIIAALVMNCGIAGDVMRFLKVTTGTGGKLIMVQGQFDKGVIYLNALKGSASGMILDYAAEMRISSQDKMVASLLKHAGEIGLIQRRPIRRGGPGSMKRRKAADESFGGQLGAE